MTSGLQRSPVAHAALPVVVSDEDLGKLPINTQQPAAWINNYETAAASRSPSATTLILFRRIEFVGCSPRRRMGRDEQVTLEGRTAAATPFPAVAVQRSGEIGHRCRILAGARWISAGRETVTGNRAGSMFKLGQRLPPEGREGPGGSGAPSGSVHQPGQQRRRTESPAPAVSATSTVGAGTGPRAGPAGAPRAVRTAVTTTSAGLLATHGPAARAESSVLRDTATPGLVGRATTSSAANLSTCRRAKSVGDDAGDGRGQRWSRTVRVFDGGQHLGGASAGIVAMEPVCNGVVPAA